MDPGSLHPGGSGWAAVLRVRLLHSAVRTRLMGQSDWDKDAWGVPINQEDLLVTQLAFSQVRPNLRNSCFWLARRLLIDKELHPESILSTLSPCIEFPSHCTYASSRASIQLLKWRSL